MSSSLVIHSPEVCLAKVDDAYPLMEGFGHRSAFDGALINAAARAIYDAGRSSEHIVEICCGYGDLLVAMGGAFPQAKITGVDQFAGTVELAQEKIEGVANASVVAGDVMRMDRFGDETVDFICGQACMHHLTHNLEAAFSEFHRVLKPGGKCIFTFEPLSHNHVVNIVRSYRNSKMLLIDESNLYVPTLERYSEKFSHTEIQCYNLTAGYLMKALPANSLFLKIRAKLRQFESFRLRRSSKSLRKAANFNAIFTK